MVWCNISSNVGWVVPKRMGLCSVFVKMSFFCKELDVHVRNYEIRRNLRKKLIQPSNKIGEVLQLGPGVRRRKPWDDKRNSMERNICLIWPSSTLRSSPRRKFVCEEKCCQGKEWLKYPQPLWPNGRELEWVDGWIRLYSIKHTFHWSWPQWYGDWSTLCYIWFPMFVWYKFYRLTYN